MKKCLIVVNSFKKEAHLLGKVILNFLNEEGIKASLYSYDGSVLYNKAKNLSENTADIDLNSVFEGNDFVVSLGGDGTVLFVSRICASLGIPVFPVNLGEFGFLAGVKKNEWKTELISFLNGKSSVAERSLVKAQVFRGNEKIFESVAMNDIVISSAVSVHLINLKVSYKELDLGNFKSDGLIIASATGSTAYSTAAGGPIVDPSMDALILTPVNSFSLSARPLVLSPDGTIEITVEPSRVLLELVADGQIPFNLTAGDVIKLNISENKARLVCSSKENFFLALQNKLNWSGGPNA